MIFVIRSKIVGTELLGAHEFWGWEFRQGTKDNPGPVLAVCPTRSDALPGTMHSEKEVRSDIARARKAFGGARMAKVVAGADLTGGSDA